jgi:uncharacterized protein
MLYLDTSALVPLFLTDDHAPIMQAWVMKEVPQVVMGDFAAAEFSAAVSRHFRMGQATRATANQTLADFDAWRAKAARQRSTGPADLVHCERLVRDFRLKLSAGDALHLAVAIAEGVPLITLDRRLAAASRRLDHPVIVPGR